MAKRKLVIIMEARKGNRSFIFHGDKKVIVTDQTADTFRVFAFNKGKIVPASRVYYILFSLRVDCDQPKCDSVVRARVSRLRKAIKPLGLDIQTVYNQGYRLVKL